MKNECNILENDPSVDMSVRVSARASAPVSASARAVCALSHSSAGCLGLAWLGLVSGAYLVRWMRQPWVTSNHENCTLAPIGMAPDGVWVGVWVQACVGLESVLWL